jgi:hypothetical protein
MESLTVKVEPLSLDNICDGKIPEQFEGALRRIADAFQDESLQEGREDLKAKVLVEVEFEYNVHTGALSTTAKVTNTLPGPRKVGGSAMLREGRFLVEPDTQESLFAHKGGRADQ